MAVMRRGELRLPVLPKQTIEVPEFGEGCEVVVRGMTLSERLQLGSDVNSFTSIARALSWTVLDADSKPLMTFEEWDLWGASHVEASMRIFSTVSRLSGEDEDALEKKSESSPTSPSA